MIKHVCDRCRQESDPVLPGSGMPKDWHLINYDDGAYTRHHYVLCPVCVEHLGIPSDYRKAREDIGTRLIKILEEIVRGTPVEEEAE